MIWTPILLSLAPLTATVSASTATSTEDIPAALRRQLERAGSTVAIRARLAETVANGPLEYAVILVENGEITAVGQDWLEVDPAASGIGVR